MAWVQVITQLRIKDLQIWWSTTVEAGSICHRDPKPAFYCKQYLYWSQIHKILESSIKLIKFVQ